MATYNNTCYTKASLDGYVRQSFKNFRIAIADDGSDSSMRALINDYKEKLNIRHIWHEDIGYRRALILNKCIATSTADYIILVDNDCVPHKYFIDDHIKYAKRNQCVTGRRVNLGSAISISLTNDLAYIREVENPLALLSLIVKNKVKDGGKGIRLPVFISNIVNMKKRGLLGSNMAVWRHDLNEVNGFDSSFTGYGAEETDLEWRMEATGVHIQSLINRAIQFHLFHEQKTRTNTNRQQINEKKRKHIITAGYGIREAHTELEAAESQATTTS